MRPMVIGVMVFAVASFVSPAQAEVTVTATQVDGDVVFEGSGTLNLNAWFYGGFLNENAKVDPSEAIFLVGPSNTTQGNFWRPEDELDPVGPENFGTGRETSAISGSGDLFGLISINGFRYLAVPDGYVSGDPLSGSATYVGETFASLGMEVGTYVWTWGDGAMADSFTLEVSTGVPNRQSSWGEIKALFK